MHLIRVGKLIVNLEQLTDTNEIPDGIGLSLNGGGGESLNYIRVTGPQAVAVIEYLVALSVNLLPETAEERNYLEYRKSGGSLQTFRAWEDASHDSRPSISPSGHEWHPLSNANMIGFRCERCGKVSANYEDQSGCPGF
jgi:hypothetical protein